MTEREKITVYRDELEFILEEIREYRKKHDAFSRERFGIAASETRLEGILGHTSDPDKTPVRPPFPPQTGRTEPYGTRVIPPKKT